MGPAAVSLLRKRSRGRGRSTFAIGQWRQKREINGLGGLETVLLDNRDVLLRFVCAHGAGDSAEEVLHEVWLRVSRSVELPVAPTLSHLYRTANNIMIERYRAQRPAVDRDLERSDETGAIEPD